MRSKSSATPLPTRCSARAQRRHRRYSRFNDVSDDPYSYGVDYLSQTLGLPPEVARGAVDYMYRNESKLDPMATNPTSGAFGLPQVLGSRKTLMLSQYGSQPTYKQQYAFIADELKSGKDGGNTLAQLRNAK